MRFSLKRYLIFLFFVYVLLFAWNFISRKYGRSTFLETCNFPKKYQDELHIFTNEVHKILKVLNVTHFLCYGSLWGEIRFSRVLPWEDKSVMCILNEEILTKDELSIIRIFKNNGFYISYQSSEGQYVVTKLNSDKKMRVLLVLFELDKVVEMYRRIGWKRRFLPPDCSLESLDCFPPRLIIPPLPIKEFGGSLIPAPREGIEMQKYHYKNNWWNEVPIKNC
ncbi:conserved hypothetical protein [Pediculus humanus corporis]|uniref:Uncharacterized protein n=1 Tax=Pediculus humanus subsp. corporis TaxID=121224 RepID=E0W348_PEDHC|nr:uncharacterized protein Phum_PHUM601230 [Pediculus humanus corporis]EEB20054.1 conserved hypothetical protein [Pediculus humanus corporis]